MDGRYKHMKEILFRRGFTIMGLIMAIAIVGVLVIGVTVVFDPIGRIQKEKDAKRKENLGQIQKALEAYYNDYGSYPLNPSRNDYRIKGSDGNPVPWGDPWVPYMGTLPKDPSSSRNYVYCSSGQSYYLYVSLERGGPITTNNCSGSTCGTGIACNYGVSSSNVSP